MSPVAEKVQPFSTESSYDDEMSGCCCSDGVYGCIFKSTGSTAEQSWYSGKDNYISIPAEWKGIATHDLQYISCHTIT